jgi:hypothetical protein
MQQNRTLSARNDQPQARPVNRVANFPGPPEEPAEVVLPLPPAVRTAECRHGPDFRSVIWFGVPHGPFSGKQAGIIAELWAAWRSGCLDVGAAYLLEAVESEGCRVPQIFQGTEAGREALGTLVISLAKGVYRLNEPARV